MEVKKLNHRQPFSTILDQLPGMFYRFENNPSLTFTYVSTGCREFTGYTSEDLTQKKGIGFRDLIHPDDRDRVLAELDSFTEEQDTCCFSFRIRTFNGEIVHVKNTASGIYDEEGKLLFIEGRIENADNNKRAGFRSLFEQSGNALLLLDPKTGYTVDCNKKAVRFLNSTHKNQVIGKQLHDFSPEFQPGGHLSKHQSASLLQKAAKSGFCHFEWAFRVEQNPETVADILLTPVIIDQKTWILAAVKDFTDPQLTAAGQDFMLSLIRDIQNSVSFKEALLECVQSITEHTQCVIGEVWLQEEESNKIKLTNCFFSGFQHAESFKNLRQDSTYRPGTGWPGTIWETKRHQWITNISESDIFTEPAQGITEKLTSAVGFPVLTDDDQTAAVLCFYMTEVAPDKTRFKHLVPLVANQLKKCHQRENIKNALKKSEQRYRAFFEEDLNANFIASPTGKIKDCNQSFAKLFGFESKEQALNSNFNDRFTNYMHQSFFWEALKRKKKILNHEMQALKTNNETVYVNLKIIGRYTHTDRLTEIVGYIQDITDRKEAEQALRNSEERYRSLIETSNDWIWEIDENFCFTYSSQKIQTILEYDPKAVIGKSLFDLMPEENIDEARQTFNKQARAQKPFLNIQQTFYDSSNNKVIFETNGIPLFDDNGIFIGYRGISKDITERRMTELKIARLNDELEHKVMERTKMLQIANKELEAFSYSVSHDLRAPLRSIDGFSQALVEDYEQSLDETAKNYLSRVRSAAQRMSTLIDDMIKLSKVSRTSVSEKKINLSEIAESVAVKLKEDEPERDVTFIIDENMTVQADKNLMEVAFQNLMGNAWKFTSNKTDARIEVGKQIIDDTVTYYVKDNGAGFNMDYAQKLFTPFQRLHKDSDYPGTGIGLSTVQRIIHRHMGNIWAESKVNEGAIFYFTLKSEEDSQSGSS